MERDDQHFDLDEDFVPSGEEEDYDRFIDRGDRRKTTAVKRGKAAWSKLEDVLAEKRLQKELKDGYDDV
jgi:hypothetical protein